MNGVTALPFKSTMSTPSNTNRIINGINQYFFRMIMNDQSSIKNSKLSP